MNKGATNILTFWTGKPQTLFLNLLSLILIPVCSLQVKADRSSKKLTVLQQASRHVNEMAANVVGSTRTGQENLDDKGEYS